MKALPLLFMTALLLAATSTPAHSATHLLTLKTAGGQMARLEADVEEDDSVKIENPVLVVKDKSYKLAKSDATSALSDLICRKVGGKHRYSLAKFKKRDKSDRSLEARNDLSLRTSKAKVVVREFHCVEDID